MRKTLITRVYIVCRVRNCYYGYTIIGRLVLSLWIFKDGYAYIPLVGLQNYLDSHFIFVSKILRWFAYQTWINIIMTACLIRLTRFGFTNLRWLKTQSRINNILSVLHILNGYTSLLRLTFVLRVYKTKAINISIAGEHFFIG